MDNHMSLVAREKSEHFHPRWHSASFALPVSANLPVEVELRDGKHETRKAVEGDWRQVVCWREKTK